jgi:CubicO group peptidase (beta-lactamase class C family)
MRALTLGLLALLLTSSARAQAPATFTDPARTEKVAATEAVVASLFREYRERADMPGFAYGVVLDGELIYSGAFGLAQIGGPGVGDGGVPADSRTLFRIASMSKSFTALAILQLRDAGRLALNDPVSRYIPEMADLDYPTDDAPIITIRHLLTHSAGFPEDNPWGDRQLAAPDEELRAHVAAGVAFSNVPGITYEYSNLGFALLGQVVEVASGMAFQDYMHEHVFSPLGMTSTVWEYERAPAERLAFGYDRVDGEWVRIPLEHHGAYGAMGGLITSIEDFARYAALHLGAWPPRSDAEDGPLHRSSLREMHQPWRFASLSTGECPTASAYAYGLRWSVDCRDRVSIGHSGGLPGFGSNWTMLPDYGLAVMSFDNRTYGSTSRVNQAVVDTIVALASLDPRRLPVPDILRQRRDQLVAVLSSPADAPESGVFAENFFMDNHPDAWVERTQRLMEEVGEIRGVGELVPMNRLRGTFILEGERQDIEVFFSLSPETVPLIQRVRLRRVER